MPDADVLWQARSASEWLESHVQFGGTFHEQPPSLRDLFRHFVEGSLRPPNSVSSSIRYKPWFAIFVNFSVVFLMEAATAKRPEQLPSPQHAPDSRKFNACCSNACANLIIYHLISLNTITCFPEIERLARCEVARGPVRQSSWLPIRCTEEVEEIFFHCGQILRLVRSIPRHVRPPWWAAAVYRVALISWANSMANAGTRFQMSQSNERDIDAQFAIDALVPEHPLIERYLKYREGLPMFSKPDGAMVSLDVPGNVLTHCIEIVDDDSTMRFTAGIRNKLGRLAERWKT
ncbi:MAG: hypothetical protein M1830_000624 [Pleopsidium flavum]|nr:MAG: hypothetical protein M1830_000624 [Pleopsidium flavum]